jgi:hypothetical protein
VLLDDDALVADLLDRGDVQRRGLQGFVLPLELVDLLAELAPALAGVLELVGELVVDFQHLGVVLPERLEALALGHVRVELEAGAVWQGRAARHLSTTPSPPP